MQPTKPLFYRALLQQLLVSKYGNDDVVINNTVGRIAHKCDTFPEYVYKALKRLNLNIQVLIYVYNRNKFKFSIRRF